MTNSSGRCVSSAANLNLIMNNKYSILVDIWSYEKYEIAKLAGYTRVVKNALRTMVGHTMLPFRVKLTHK